MIVLRIPEAVSGPVRPVVPPVFPPVAVSNDANPLGCFVFLFADTGDWSPD